MFIKFVYLFKIYAD